MKLTDYNNSDIKKQDNLSSKFQSIKGDNVNFTCNVLNSNFYLDTHNYYPITDEMFTFSELFMWGDTLKYDNFYKKDFIDNFNLNKKNFKSFSDTFILGSSAQDNYYRNIISFLPRIFYTNKKKINIAVHRNTPNKFRNFIKIICNKNKIETKFIFLDDGFYKFKNSQIPQFLDQNNSIKILNNLVSHKIANKKKIYVSRQNCHYRNLVNENDILSYLTQLNFEIVDLNNFSIPDQIDLFSSAEVIISPTGSGLVNTVFCQKGTKIIEITPQYNHKYEDIFKNRYSSIAKILGLEYFSLEADSINIDNPRSRRTIIPKIYEESNYFKNLIVKVKNLKSILNFNN